MPELPEMQALAERLHHTYAGAIVTRAHLLQFSALKTFDPSIDALTGQTVDDVGRRGKYLVFGLGTVNMLVHLSQGGRIDLEDPPKTTRPKGAVARFVFPDRPSLLLKEYGTERKAALWVLRAGDTGPLADLGPDPFSDEFASLIASGSDRRRLHTMLRDQKTVAGIGRGYTDDALHHARLSPFTSLDALAEDERDRLLASVRAVLEAGLTQERRRTGGLPAKLSGRFAVHGRFGEPCPRCGEVLQRVSYESHEVVYCPSCQTGGKLLADRRLSRLLK